MITPADFFLRPMKLAPADPLMKEMLPPRLTVEQAVQVVRALLNGRLSVVTASPLRGRTAKTWVEVRAQNHGGLYTIALSCMNGMIGNVWAVITPKGSGYDVDADGGNAALILSVDELQALTKRFSKESAPKGVPKKELPKLHFNKKGQIKGSPRKHSVN